MVDGCASHTGHGSHIVVVVLLFSSSCILRLILRRKLFRCSSAAVVIDETRHIDNRDESDLILFIGFCNIDGDISILLKH